MRTLVEYIKESSIELRGYMRQQLLLEAYDQCTENWKELVNHIKSKRANDLCTNEFYDTVYKLLKQIFDKGGKFRAVYDKSSPVFKISRFYVNSVDNLFSNGNVIIDDYEFSCRIGGGTDRTIYCETVRNSYNQHIKVFELGTGSIGKVKTEEQEQATVSIWNYLIDNGIDIILKDPNRYETITTNVTELAEQIKADDTWIMSCVSQVEQILKFLRSRPKISKDDIKNYRAIRYGYKDPQNSDNVAQAHELFLKNYLNLVKISNDFSKTPQKDNYDPSDILLYNHNKQTEISNKLKELTKLTDVNQIFDEYKNLFDKDLLFGISLKKMSKEPSFELFNINRSGKTIKDYVCTVENVEECKTTKNGNGAYAIIEGKFSFEGIANPETIETNNKGDVIVKDFTTKTLKVSLRTFGSGTIGLDIAEMNGKSTGPALGKVPVNIWRTLLKVNERANLETCITNFINVFGNVDGKNTEKSNKQIAEEIIVGGIKNGPWCLPFVLVH